MVKNSNNIGDGSYLHNLRVRGKKYKLPLFLPDATLGVVRSVTGSDIKEAGTRGVVVNTYHLRNDPGIEILRDFGGIKEFMGFDGLVVSDSGGWQVFSMIHRSNNKGEISDKGVKFKIGKNKNKIFTPEKSIKAQFDMGSDVVVCLDDFTPPSATREGVLESVKRTTRWAQKSKEEYLRQVKERGLNDSNRPLIFAVIQGHMSKSLRKKSAKELVEIGFDGYGFGGYLVDESGNLDFKMSGYIANLIPKDKYKFALGVGKPWDIAKLYKMGWEIFDCTLPTRDARHKRLYVFNGDIEKDDLSKKQKYDYVYIGKSKYKNDSNPISANCNCFTCKKYSRAYLHHLFKIKETLAFRLATIHNLRFYNLVVENL